MQNDILYATGDGIYVGFKTDRPAGRRWKANNQGALDFAGYQGTTSQKRNNPEIIAELRRADGFGFSRFQICVGLREKQAFLLDLRLIFL